MQLPLDRGSWHRLYRTGWLVLAVVLVAASNSHADQNLSATEISFNITAQPLDTALLAFAGQAAEVRLVFKPEQVAGMQAPAVVGKLSAQLALQQLLADLPLTLRLLDAGMYVIEPVAMAKTAVVETAVVQPNKSVQGSLFQPAHGDMEELVTLGTRARDRKLLYSRVPVDIVHGYALERSAPASVGEQLQSQMPSFNYSRTTVSDGADLVRPATLRGMNPDQLLVMVNGKRRHHQAQINIQQVVGRGSSGTDMNAIPVAALERVEVLRDGASAQYGSDAIAGVLNLVLKSGDQPPQLNVQYGATKVGDGQSLISSFSAGVESDDTSLFVALEMQDRAATNRAAVDQRFDPPQVSMRIGDTEQRSHALFLNGQWELTELVELYAFAGSSRREGLSAGFYRGAGARAGEPPVNARYVPELDPEGFLPLQTTRTEDDFINLGALWQLSDNWRADLSTGVGENRFLQGTEYSVNVSLGSASPTAADNGELRYRQWQTSASASGILPTSNVDELILTVGGEWRQEQYAVTPGDFASYAYGPEDDFSVFIPSPVDPCPAETGSVCGDGSERSRAQAGMQAYPGYRLAVEDQRNSFAWFVDGDIQVNEKFGLALASRWEGYGDVGRNLNGKLAFSYKFTPAFIVRGAVATGFRAPGINQRSFSHVITNIGANVLTNTLHAAENSAPLQALGIKTLDAERSRQLSAGAVWAPNNEFSLTLDAFHVQVRGAIALSGVVGVSDIDCGAICPFAEALAVQGHNIGAVQFLFNALDTTTEGVDLVARYRHNNRYGQFAWSMLGHYNQTEVTHIYTPSHLNDVLFSPSQVQLTEEGQPRRRLLLALDWQRANWSSGVRLNRYGAVRSSYFTAAGLGAEPTGSGDRQHESGAAWLLDADVGYRFASGLTLAIGGSNLLDTYPDPLPEDSLLGTITGGSFVYPWETSPYGINGAFYYVRAEYRW